MDLPSQSPEAIQSTWIFGYGSLVHTPNFAFDQRVVGYIKGYRRVFWQGSTDHRGTPQRPGRTVTLVKDDHPSTTWGVAFQLQGTPEEQAAALSYLEWREKQYDVRQLVDVHDKDGEVAVRGALVYIASPANSNYLGPADVRDIAAQIATSRGPSGPNCEYLFKLADAMRSMDVPDPDLYGLENMVRRELVRVVVEPDTLQAAGTRVAAVGMAMVATTTAEEKDVEEVEPSPHDDYRRWHQQGRLELERQQQGEPEQGQDDDRLQQQQQQGLPTARAEQASGDVCVSQTRTVYSLEAVCVSGRPSSSEPG